MAKSGPKGWPKDRARTFGDRLRETRESLGWTQTELGNRSGVNRVQVSYAESGFGLMGVESLVRIADALGTTTDYLLGRCSRPAARFVVGHPRGPLPLFKVEISRKEASL